MLSKILLVLSLILFILYVIQYVTTRKLNIPELVIFLLITAEALGDVMGKNISLVLSIVAITTYSFYQLKKISI